MVRRYVVAKLLLSGRMTTVVGQVVSAALRLVVSGALGHRGVEQGGEPAAAFGLPGGWVWLLACGHRELSPPARSGWRTRRGVTGLLSATTSIEVMMLRRLAIKAPYSGQCRAARSSVERSSAR